MLDFTFDTYRRLVRAVVGLGLPAKTFAEVIKTNPAKYVIFRHDVDRKPLNSLKIAQILNEEKIKGTFYFRIVPASFQTKIIKEISDLGHEIGYHYEDLTLSKGDIDRAKVLFKENLEKLRQHAHVSTICMHGSPLSKYDNRDLWQHIDYRDYDIIGEPYRDIDFKEVLYLTDTGRKWDNKAVSVRDKVISDYGKNFSSTQDIIHRIKELPQKVMFTTHPQRWNNNPYFWGKELVYQNFKNTIKKYFFVKDTDEY